MLVRNQHTYGPIPQAPALAVKQLAIALAPSIITAFGLAELRNHIAAETAMLYLPLWVVVLLSVFAAPVLAAVKIKHREWSEGRRATAFGAPLPIRRTGKWLGNLDIVPPLFKSLETGFLGDFTWNEVEKLGETYEFYVLWNRVLITSDVNIVKTILANDFGNYVKGQQFDQYTKSVLGTGVFNSDGEMWKFHRTLLRPFFVKDRNSYFGLFERHTDAAIADIKKRHSEGYAIDFQDLMARFSLDSTMEMLFGVCVQSLEDGLPYPWNAPSQRTTKTSRFFESFDRAFAEAQNVIATRTRIGLSWPFFELYKDRSAEPMKIIDTYLLPIIEAAVAKHKKAKVLGLEQRPEDMGDEKVLVDHLIEHTEDLVLLRDEVINIMMAARDSASTVLTVVVYFLSQYPQVMRRLHQEVLETVGHIRCPTKDDIRGMKYLRAVINESMRLYPPVPWNVRYNVSDTAVQTSEGANVFLPAGTPIMYSVHRMHHRTDYWGPDAEEFDPDRFLDHRVQQYLAHNPSIFLPFNTGPRVCLGQHFAYNQLSFFLIKLMQSFDSIDLDMESLDPKWRPREEWKGAEGRKGVEKMWPWSHLTLYIKGGVWVKMEKGEGEEQEE